MGFSFQDRNRKDSQASYRPHASISGLPGEAQRSQVVPATLRCGAATIMILDFGAVVRPPEQWLRP